MKKATQKSYKPIILIGIAITLIGMLLFSHVILGNSHQNYVAATSLDSATVIEHNALSARTFWLDTHSERIVDLTNATYVIDGVNISVTSNSVPVNPNWMGRTITVMRLGDTVSHNLEIPTRRIFITNTASHNTTDYYRNDGRIAGVTEAMEWRRQGDATWNTVTGDQITGLAVGDYEIRYSATVTNFASEIFFHRIIIGFDSRPTITSITISGDATREGNRLTPVITVSQGQMNTAELVGQFNFVWQLHTGNGWQNIQGANEYFFVIGRQHLGNHIRVVATSRADRIAPGSNTSTAVYVGATGTNLATIIAIIVIVLLILAIIFLIVILVMMGNRKNNQRSTARSPQRQTQYGQYGQHRVGQP